MKKVRLRCMGFLLLLCSSAAWGADPAMLQAIVMCESGGRTTVCGDDGVSCGIAQFQKRTFYKFEHEAGLHGMHWKNSGDQMILLNWGLDNGYGKHWTCYRTLYLHERCRYVRVAEGRKFRCTANKMEIAKNGN